jgi:hypothetical protein
VSVFDGNTPRRDVEPWPEDRVPTNNLERLIASAAPYIKKEREAVERAKVDAATRPESDRREGVKVCELTGALLDYWVARAEGYEWANDVEPIRAVGAPMYSASWSDGGPLIERERISVSACYSGEWRGIMHVNGKVILSEAGAPLVAAMRCYVASKFGDKVEKVKP